MKKTSFKSESGFTLLEVLASMIVLAAISTVVVGIITSTLQGSNKTNNIENIRKNGNYALSQIAKDIEYAQPLDGNSTGFSNDGTTYSVSCLPSSGFESPKYITVKTYIEDAAGARYSTVQYYCTGTIAANSSLTKKVDAGIETSLITASVALENCSFSCAQSTAIDIPVIGIKFKIGLANQNNLVENSSLTAINFGTFVSMRNYK